MSVACYFSQYEVTHLPLQPVPVTAFLKQTSRQGGKPCAATEVTSTERTTVEKTRMVVVGVGWRDWLKWRSKMQISWPLYADDRSQRFRQARYRGALVVEDRAAGRHGICKLLLSQQE